MAATAGHIHMRAGDLYFGNDLYGRDDQLVQQIASGTVTSPAVEQNIQALKRLVNE